MILAENGEHVQFIPVKVFKIDEVIPRLSVLSLKKHSGGTDITSRQKSH
jgi:hypothetical protein